MNGNLRIYARDSMSSYHSTCSDHSPQRRHEVHCHWCAHPGQRPAVAKVFHVVPHDGNGGSGPPSLKQTQLLEAAGCHWQRGHLIRRTDSAPAGPDASFVTLLGASAFLNRCHSDGVGSVPVVST